MPTEQDARDHIRRMQSIGSEEAMQSAATAERELERSRLDQLRKEGADTPERAALEDAYPKRKGGGGGGGSGSGSGSSDGGDDLLTLTRGDLNARAAQAGIEDAAQLPNKEAVADAIREREKGD